MWIRTMQTSRDGSDANLGSIQAITEKVSWGQNRRLLASLFSAGSFWNHRLVTLSFVPVFTSAAGCNEGFEISLHGGERRVCENSSDQPWYASCVAYRCMVSTYRVFPSVFLWRYTTILELANWQHGRNTNKIESIANMNAQQWSVMHISSHGCLRDQKIQVDRLDPNLPLPFLRGKPETSTNAVPLVPGLSGWHGERGKDRCTSCRTGWAHLSRSPGNPKLLTTKATKCYQALRYDDAMMQDDAGTVCYKASAML